MILGVVGAVLVAVVAVVLGRRGAGVVVRYHQWAWSQRDVPEPPPSSGSPAGELAVRIVSGVGALGVVVGAIWFGR